MLELTDQTGLVVKRISLQLRTTIQPDQSYLYRLRSAVLELRKILKKKKTVTLFSKGLIWSISSDFWKAYLEPTLTHVTNRSHRALSIQSKIPEISDINQMEQTISVRSDRNIWDNL